MGGVAEEEARRGDKALYLKHSHWQSHSPIVDGSPEHLVPHQLYISRVLPLYEST